jgi:hypothetical protein
MSQLDTYLESLVPYVAQQIGVPNLTIDLVKRVIRQESGGNQGAKSKAGAIGLMQLMPATAAELGVNPNDPQQNLYGGVLYLAQQMKRFNGDPALGLAAYNAGAGNVQKYGGIPPFEETQNYVKSILGSSGDNNSSFNNTDMQETNNQTNIQEIVKQKIAQGIEISEEELSALKENKINKIKEKLQNDIEISPEELSFVKEYKGIKDTPQDKLQQKKTAINEQKTIDDLNRLAPVLDVKLNAQGETVRERYLKKVYGEGNVSVDPETNEFYVKGGGNSLVPAPKPTFVGQLGAMGGDVVAGAVGEGIGASAFGVPGAVIGAGLGAAAGTGVNFTKATAAAAAQGLVKPEELKEIAKSGGFASATSGVLGSVFGGLGQALKPLAQSLKISGNTGLGIGKMKGEIQQQVMSDDLLKQIDPAVQAEAAANDSISYFGNAAKQGIENFLNRVDEVGNKYFNNIDARVKKEIETGKVRFADVSDIYNDLVTNLGKLDGKEIPAGTAPQIVERLQKALSGTTGVFNPKTVTAGDFRSAINTISSLYDEGINTFASKPLAQFRTDLTNKALEAGGNFAKYKKAFEIFKMKQAIPEALQDIKSLKGSEVAKRIFKMPREVNEQFGKFVNQNFSPELAQQFKTGLLKDVIYRTPILKEAIRKTPKEVPAEVLEQLPVKTLKEGRDAVEQGINLQMKGVKQTLAKGREAATSVNEPFISGKGIKDFFLSEQGQNVAPLLSGTKINPTYGRQLESAQKAAGLVTRVPDSANFNNEAVSAAAPVVEKVIRKSNIGSIALDALGGIINPIQRGLGAAGEAAAPIFGSGIVPSIVRPAAGNLIGSLAGINPVTNFSNTALTEEQHKRLIGGVRNGQR